MAEKIISLVNRPQPPWSNWPADGLDLVQEAELARVRGGSRRMRLLRGVSGGGAAPDMIEFDITDAGQVVMVRPGYEPVIDDLKLIGLRVLEASDE